MPGLRTSTTVFLVLTLLPAGLLGWLGWRASLPLVEELRRSARDATQRAAVEVATALPLRIAALAGESTERLRAVAVAVWERLPLEPPGVVLRAAEAALSGALVLTNASGRSLLAHGDKTPVIVLSARGQVEDRVLGLHGGADDLSSSRSISRAVGPRAGGAAAIGRRSRATTRKKNNAGRPQVAAPRPRHLSARIWPRDWPSQTVTSRRFHAEMQASHPAAAQALPSRPCSRPGDGQSGASCVNQRRAQLPTVSAMPLLVAAPNALMPGSSPSTCA
ncbi:MAG: hypothetical protein ABIP94_08795 [Planctomycetota bacterium]